MNKQSGDYLGTWRVRNTTSGSRGNIYKTKLLLILLLFLGSIFSNAHAVPMNYLGAWNPTTIYDIGSVVSFDNASYYSIRSSISAPNKNKVPSSKPLWWEMIGLDTTALAKRVKDLELKSAALTVKVSELESKNAALTSEIQNLQAGIIPNLGDVLEYDVDNDAVVFTGVNVKIVNGMGVTNSTNSLGNLIVGYNESHHNGEYCSDGQYQAIEDCLPPNVWGSVQRTGSHNIVVGEGNDFTNNGFLVGGSRNIANGHYGLLFGNGNMASGDHSSTLGGRENKSLGEFSAIVGGNANSANANGSIILGGEGNLTSGHFCIIAGGNSNIGSGHTCSILGGANNIASYDRSTVSGGYGNTASGSHSSVIGGTNNIASGEESSISGGETNIASGRFSSVSGGRFNEASGYTSSVSGGYENTSSAHASNVSGGPNIIMSTDLGWAAGSLREE